VTAFLAVLWVLDPAGNYEPWTVISGSVCTGIEIYRRIRSRGQSESVPPTGPKPKRKSKAEEIIDWIQKYGTEKPLSQVLPRALQLAQLIRGRDLEHWVRMELYGYNREGGMTEQDAVPEYRAVTGRYLDQYNRILHIDDPELGFVNSYRFRYGVRILEELAQKTDMQNIRDEDMIQILRQHLNVDIFRFCFSPVELTGVLDYIRNRLLEKVGLIEQERK
jgi:hypothetical protein